MFEDMAEVYAKKKAESKKIKNYIRKNMNCIYLKKPVVF